VTEYLAMHTRRNFNATMLAAMAAPQMVSARTKRYVRVEYKGQVAHAQPDVEDLVISEGSVLVSHKVT